MQSAPYYLISIIPALGMLSGLSVSYSVFLFCLTCVVTNHREFNLKSCLLAKQFKLISQNHKIEIIFFLWCILCSINSVNPPKALLSLAKISSTIIFALIIVKNIKIIEQAKIFKPLIFGIALALILFYIEYFSSGIITKTFRIIFQETDKQAFYLYYLDRGCALLSVLSFILIKLTIDTKKYTLALFLYITILITLYLSDSLASLIAYTISGIILIFLIIKPFLSKICTYSIMTCSILLSIVFYNIKPMQIINQYPQLPISSKHRLLIWNFTAHKALESPIIGIGFNGSKYANINKYVNYEGQDLHLFPMHPHNSILQILIELGVPGLLLSLGLLYKNIINLKDPTIYSTFACYFIISLISYNMWQSWWIFTGIFVYLLNAACRRSVGSIVTPISINGPHPE